MARGRFITLEGGEGAGKSTQIARLADRLIQAGIDVVTTREPGGTPGAEAIRGLLVAGDTDRWDGLTETLLHTAARRAHVEGLVRPSLDAGRWVVCDRFVDSTVAYQGVAQGVGAEVVLRLHDLAIGGLMPDLTLVLDLPVDQGLARAAGRHARTDGDEARYERFGPDFHNRLRAAFHDRVTADPDRCVLIDATGDVDGVADAVWRSVGDRLSV